jgi:putative tricarboxylic transport membrane protein
MSSSMSRRSVLGMAAGAALMLGTGQGFAQQQGSAPQMQELNIMAPAAPGGGWDGTARAFQQTLQQEGIVPTVEVTNVPGAGGTIGLAQFANADADDLMVSGLVMVGAILTQNSPVTLDDVTPLARLIGEYEVIVVPADSEFETLDELIAAFKENPGSIAWGGGSAGGADHILVGQIAQEVGVPADQVNYIAHAGGGEALASLLANDVAAGVSGYAEFAGQIAAGELRPLAISSPDRLEGVDVPTLKEQGIDVEFLNWRGLFGAGDLTDEERQQLLQVIEQAVKSDTWQQILKERNWVDTYLAGDEFANFLAEDRERIEMVLKDVGLVN